MQDRGQDWLQGLVSYLAVFLSEIQFVTQIASYDIYDVITQNSAVCNI